MLKEVFWFELRYHFSQTVFRIATLLFFLLGIIAVRGGFGNEVYKNSPYVIMNITGLLSLFSIFPGILFCANVVLRDNTNRFDAILFSTSVTRQTWLLSRFTGLLTAVLLMMIFASFGMMAGCLLLPSAELGVFNLFAYGYALLVIAFPNVLFCCSVLFAIAVLSGRVRAVYGAGVLLYVLYWAGSILGNSPLLATSDPTATPGMFSLLADPFGLSIFFKETKQWAAEQRNALLLPLNGTFLINRLCWTFVSVAILLLVFRVFRFRLKASGGVEKQAADSTTISVAPHKASSVRTKGFLYSWRSFTSQFRLETVSLFRHIPFMVIMILWIFMYAVELRDSLADGIYHIRSYPDTSRMLEELTVIRPLMILIIFYAAELIWRERSVNVHSLVYSTAVGNFSLWAAKLSCLVILIAIVITANISISIGVQWLSGYDDIRLPAFLQLFYYSGIPLCLFAILSVFVVTIVPGKYTGMLVAVLLAAVIVFSSRIGIEHYLLRFASVPEMLNSAMNGFGHYASAFNWYMLYWSGLAIVLAVLSIVYWKGGRQATFRSGFKGMTVGSGRRYGIIAIVGIVLFAATGGWIFYQTNIIVKYRNRQTAVEWRIGYEKKYRAFALDDQPVITAVETMVDLYPGEQRYTVRGVYTIKNTSLNVIKRILTGIDPSVTESTVILPVKHRLLEDKEYGQYIFTLEQPLLPGQSMKISFTLKTVRSGFTPFNNEHSVVRNGSYIELEKYLPYFGYNDGLEEENEANRVRYRLPARPPLLPVDSVYHLVDFETTIATDQGQQVVTVGELRQKWDQNDRSFFHYKTSRPVPFMFALSAAKYELKEEIYKGVSLQLFYHKGHEMNVSAMLMGMKDALDYGNAQFAPYPFKQLKLAEIPQYRGAATAYPGVLFSAERISFLSDYRDTTRINQAYAIAVHETAHQWWGVKMQPAALPGNKVLTESLAKYTENAVIRKRFGQMILNNYLREDNELYRTYRSLTDNEQSMDTVTTQPFVYYQKGGLLLYSLAATMSEPAFDQVLQDMITQYGDRQVRPVPGVLCHRLREKSGSSVKKYVDELFHHVITWNVSLDSIRSKPLPDGRFEVYGQFTVVKFDGPFHHTRQVSADDSIAIAVFDDLPQRWNHNTKPSLFQKCAVKTGKQAFRMIVDTPAAAVVIDPFMSLIGDDPEDNIRTMGLK